MMAVAILVTAIASLILGGGVGYAIRLSQEKRLRETQVLISRVRFNALQEKAGEKPDTTPPPDYFSRH